MQPRQISFDSIRPFVRFAKEVPVSDLKRPGAVLSYDHRLMYAVSGSGILEINGSLREIHPGMVLYWMSGTPYSLRARHGNTLDVIAVNFDFTHGKSSIVRFLPLALPRDYRPERRLETLCFTDSAAMNAPVILPALPAALPCLQAIMAEQATPDSFSDFQSSLLLGAVLNLIRRHASRRQSGRERHGPLQPILEYIQAHYGEALDSRALARQFHYHPNYISQLIASETGVPLHQYLLKIRIREALFLLQSTDLPIREIAIRVGFKNSSYFSRYFKKITGYTPGSFRIDQPGIKRPASSPLVDVRG